jgi:hypothetical protein
MISLFTWFGWDAIAGCIELGNALLPPTNSVYTLQCLAVASEEGQRCVLGKLVHRHKRSSVSPRSREL